MNATPSTMVETAAEPSDLAVAVDLGQRLLDGGNPVAIREALRILLRATLAEAGERR